MRTRGLVVCFVVIAACSPAGTSEEDPATGHATGGVAGSNESGGGSGRAGQGGRSAGQGGGSAGTLPGDWATSIEEAAFANGPLPNGVSATVTTFEVSADMACPDGLPARFRVIRPSAQEAGRPLVLVLHGGVFDAVVNGSRIASEPKLERPWAECKLANFLGLGAECGGGESNGGAISAALVEAGAVAVYPLGCWGDLWHGTGRLDPEDGFARHGLSLALNALDWTEREFDTDATARHAWGTSAGGHGMAEVLLADATIQRFILDAPADYLPAFLAAHSDPAAAREAARRIFDGDGSDDHVGSFSFASAIQEQGMKPDVSYVFSCNDTSISSSVMEPAAKAIIESYNAVDNGCVIHATRPPGSDAPDLASHVFTNGGDIRIARPLVTFLLEGTSPPYCESAYTPCP